MAYEKFIKKIFPFIGKKYRVVEETPEEHEAIIAWYKSILDLDQHALTATSIPSKIAKYL